MANPYFLMIIFQVLEIKIFKHLMRVNEMNKILTLIKIRIFNILINNLMHFLNRIFKF